MAKQPDTSKAVPATDVAPPSTGPEIEIQAVLWEHGAVLGEGKALKLGQIHKLIKDRRRRYGDPEPALTTVSSALRNAVAKGLLREMVADDTGEVQEFDRPQVRATLMSTRSGPKVAYAAIYSPAQVLPPMLRLVAEAYPEAVRKRSVVDLARAVELEPDVVQKIERLVS